MKDPGEVQRHTILSLRRKKGREKITMLTAYDYPFAHILDQAGIDVILVGDSLGNVVLGEEDTLAVTMDDMIRHTRAVTRGVRRALVVGDMPFLSYQVSEDVAVANAGRFLAEGRAQAVKLEGGEAVLGLVRRMTLAGIPVMSHLGLTPQSYHQLGGFRVQGKDEVSAARIKEEARKLEETGAFALVLECVPEELATEITGSLAIPTLGIGAGTGTDGQVLVLHDLLGLSPGRVPRHCTPRLQLREIIGQAVRDYVQDVKTGPAELAAKPKRERDPPP